MQETMSSAKSIIRRADESGIPLLLIRLFLGGFFIYTGLVKIGDPIDFLRQIRSYHLLPETPPIFLNGTAIVLPWLEVLCGIGLILGVSIRGAAALIAAMLCIFTPAIFLRAMVIHNTEGTPFFQIAFDCGCGTGDDIIWQKLLANIGLLVVSVVALLLRSHRFTFWGLNRCRAAAA